MAKVPLSEPEKLFIIHGVQENFRVDGRSCMDYRMFELEINVIPNCSGSAFVKLGDTKLLAGVKAEVDKPLLGSPNRGRVEVSVQCPASAHSDFAARGGESIAAEVSKILTQACNDKDSLDFKSLCIIPGQQVWVLYVDITVLVYGPGVMDAASIAVKAALFDTKIPSVSVKSDGENEPEIEVSEDPYDVVRLDVTNVPCIIGLERVGSQFIIDPTNEEISCSKASLAIAVSSTNIVLFSQMCKGGSLHIESISDILETGKEIGVNLNKQIMEKLKLEVSTLKNKKGFADLI